MTLTRTTISAAGLAAAGLVAVCLILANFAGDGENGGGPELAVTLGGSLVVLAALFAGVIPRTARPAAAGLAIGVVAVLSILVFWTGLPFVLGPAAAVLGAMGLSRAHPRGPAVAALALGALATAGGVLVLVLDLAS